mmetsp:Transcript_21149/g.54938  ORF Transcript_21149/g.54938 Transcript_21149/m.54938 type:complete len:94 (+) Transcript_21149:861-1142(+)
MVSASYPLPERPRTGEVDEQLDGWPTGACKMDEWSDECVVPLDEGLAQERAHAKSNLDASLAEQQRVVLRSCMVAVMVLTTGGSGSSRSARRA